MKPPKDNEKNEVLSVSMKGVIENHKKNLIMVLTITIKVYMYLWNKCLLMTKFIVEILVTVHN